MYIGGALAVGATGCSGGVIAGHVLKKATGQFDQL